MDGDVAQLPSAVCVCWGEADGRVEIWLPWAHSALLLHAAFTGSLSRWQSQFLTLPWDSDKGHIAANVSHTPLYEVYQKWKGFLSPPNSHLCLSVAPEIGYGKYTFFKPRGSSIS